MVVNIARETRDRPKDGPPVYDAHQLLKGGDLAQIKLDDQFYTLRMTRAGKLILTK